ncbi:MAG TPA: VCBS repeat-containing protein, partial [Saprospiraceae bacterium]|nr:VCBS repeat-containing protein [Saprospiraceae bacterium]
NQISYAQCDPKCYGKKKFIIDTIPIKLEKLLQSTVDVSLFQTPLVCDMDNDGKTEIITSSIITQTNSTLVASNILILDAKSGNVKKTISTPYYCTGGTLSLLVSDVNNDCNWEFIIAAMDNNSNEQLYRGKLVCYDINGTILWISDKQYGSAISTDRFGGALGTADFNQDGLPEAYIYNEIFNAQTGIKLCSGGNNGMGEGNSFGGRLANSLAINVDDNISDLELVAGFTVYKVLINNISGETGNIMTANNILINNIVIDGLTSFADLNNDAIPEIIISSNASKSTSGLYVFTYKNGVYTLLSGPDKFFPNELWVTGIPLLLKFNQTEDIKCVLSKDNKIIAINLSQNGSLNLVNEIPVLDGSARLGVTGFDIDGDGNIEIIYRDEEALKIFQINGNNYKLTATMPCISATAAEIPIVADIDGSGQAKICVTCATKISDRTGKLTIFGPPPGQRWAPARNIWHQYAYNPLFINDDGTVPQYMHNPATYKNGKYNNFMVQESLIDEDGNYPVAAASLTGTATCIDYDIATQQYTVDFSVHNRVDASASALSGLAVSFYNGNPEAGGTLIGVYRT